MKNWKSIAGTMFILTLVVGAVCSAQTMSNYAFSATSGTFTALAGATNPSLSSESAGGTDEGGFNAVPIGFDFFYMGTKYTSFSASTNGWVVLGRANLLLGSTADFGFTNNLSTDTRRPILAPLWDDLDLVSASNFSYLLSGSAPNRIFTAQWLNVKWSSGATTASVSFQLKLYETSGRVDFVYRQEAGLVQSTTSGATIGISAVTTGSPNFLSLNGTGTSPSASTSTETVTLSTRPATGQVYTFTPPQTPSAPTSLLFTSVSNSAMTLNWSDNSANETGFAIYKSTDNSTFTYDTKTSANATSITRSGLSGGTTYYWKVYAVTEGGLSSALSGNQQTKFGGTMTVGSGGNFSTLTAAFAKAHTDGLTGPATLELLSGYSGSGETFPITVNSISGTSATNTLTVRPQTGVTGLSVSTSAGAIFSFDAVTYVTLDGRAGGAGSTQLTFNNTSTSGNTIYFTNGASNNTVKFCTIKGATTTDGVVTFFLAGATGNSNNTVSDCTIQDGASHPKRLIYFEGDSALPNTGNSIIRCDISNADGNAIELDSNATSTLIDSCTIHQTSPPSGGTSLVTGIMILKAPSTTIRSNKIYDLTCPNHNVEGISYLGANGTPMDVVLVNNFISFDAVSTTPNSNPIGLLFQASATNTLEAYFNTIYIGGSNVTGLNSVCVDQEGSGTFTFKNNIVINARSNGSGGGSHGAIDRFGSNTNILDYNLYFATGTGGRIGFWGISLTTLSSLQGASGQEAHSVSKAVTFTSTSTNDFHLSGGSIGDAGLIGTPIAGITNDIDNNTRSVSFPYKGADENTGTPLPVELTSFTATTHAGIVELSWSTATETNNYGFEVERRPLPNPPLLREGIKGWGRIGFIAGAGTSNAPKEYSFTDKNLSASKYEYRLKQIDRDGNFHYSQSVEVEVRVAPKVFELLQNYPNPFNPTTNIAFTIQMDGRATLKVFNNLGQEIATLADDEFEAGTSHWVSFDASKLSSGIYFARLQSGNEVRLRKMVLMK